MALFPEPDNVTQLDLALDHVQTITNGAYGIGFSISAFIIIFIVGWLSTGSKAKSFTAGAFTFTIISFLFAFGDWLNLVFGLAGVFLTALGVMLIRYEQMSA